jgi:hypothetical protein
VIKLNETTEILDQYQHETMMWVRSLEFFKSENSYLKNRLSEVVDKSSNKYFLAQAEHFQNQFIIKDEFIDELKHDINEQNRKVKNVSKLVGLNIDEIVGKYTEIQDKLREQIAYLEKDFSQLRNEFQEYLFKRPLD